LFKQFHDPPVSTFPEFTGPLLLHPAVGRQFEDTRQLWFVFKCHWKCSQSDLYTFI